MKKKELTIQRELSLINSTSLKWGKLFPKSPPYDCFEVIFTNLAGPGDEWRHLMYSELLFLRFMLFEPLEFTAPCNFFFSALLIFLVFFSWERTQNEYNNRKCRNIWGQLLKLSLKCAYAYSDYFCKLML